MYRTRRLTKWLKRISLIAMVCVSGCAGFYKQPGESSPHAKLQLTRTKYEQYATGGLQQFLAYDNAACASAGGEIIETLSVVTADVKQARLPPGQRIFIKAVTVGFDKMARSCDDSVGWCLANSTCANLTSFVPETGKSYSIRHDVTSKSCGIVLIDQSTNLPPTTTKVEPVAGACKP